MTRFGSSAAAQPTTATSAAAATLPKFTSSIGSNCGNPCEESAVMSLTDSGVAGGGGYNKKNCIITAAAAAADKDNDDHAHHQLPLSTNRRRRKSNVLLDKIPARLVLYFLSWSGFLVSFMMRNDINFALVVMVPSSSSSSSSAVTAVNQSNEVKIRGRI